MHCCSWLTNSFYLDKWKFGKCTHWEGLSGVHSALGQPPHALRSPQCLMPWFPEGSAHPRMGTKHKTTMFLTIYQRKQLLRWNAEVSGRNSQAERCISATGGEGTWSFRALSGCATVPRATVPWATVPASRIHQPGSFPSRTLWGCHGDSFTEARLLPNSVFCFYNSRGSHAGLIFPAASPHPGVTPRCLIRAKDLHPGNYKVSEAPYQELGSKANH